MEELLKAALHGNQNAYVELIELMEKDLYTVARIKLNNTDDVYDAVHETILKSFQYLNQLQSKESFRAWITKILINECNAIYRSKLKQKIIFTEIVKNKIIFDKNRIEMTENDFDFHLLLKPLNEDEKIVVTLYYNNHFTAPEIANILDTNVNTIKTRLLRAKEKIKRKFEMKGGNEKYETRR